MRNPSFTRTLLLSAADVSGNSPIVTTGDLTKLLSDTVDAKPVAKRVRKPATVAKPAKPTKAAAKAAEAATPAKPSHNVTRTCATVAAQRTNFSGLSDRDTAYITFYASLAAIAKSGNVTVLAIAESGRRPNYNGSNKPHDAGVIVRLTKAGVLASAADGAGFTFTKHGRTLAAYAAGAKRA